MDNVVTTFQSPQEDEIALCLTTFLSPDLAITFPRRAEHYLRYKADGGKRSLKEDTRILKTRLLPAFGAELPARRLTETLIAQYEKRRTGQGR